jgi:hypothetical protein
VVRASAVPHRLKESAALIVVRRLIGQDAPVGAITFALLASHRPCFSFAVFQACFQWCRAVIDAVR